MAHDGMEMLAALTSPSAAAAFSLCSFYLGRYVHHHQALPRRLARQAQKSRLHQNVELALQGKWAADVFRQMSCTSVERAKPGRALRVPLLAAIFKVRPSLGHRPTQTCLREASKSDRILLLLRCTVTRDSTSSSLLAKHKVESWKDVDYI